MRFTRFSGIAATAALGAATVLGGAGIAQAGSLGSLTAGSSAPAPLVLDLEDAGKEKANGTLTNDTEEALECTVILGNSKAVAGEEAAVAADATHDVQPFAGQFAFVPGIQVPANGSADWDVTYTELADDPVAGAGAFCGDAGKDRLHAFDYESDGTGSLDNVLGSLGSSNGEATDDDAPNGDNDKGDADKNDTGLLGSLGSSNDEDKTPA
ncbi:hypothetical protein [Dietzia alimentaria]|uniref:hypothetical protein n=1 Tax=Dietzia alimentaria TaxID=665550 RepID=UPI00029A5730|nr:hypothetical protein [Dietzia alimentaria]